MHRVGILNLSALQVFLMRTHVHQAAPVHFLPTAPTVVDAEVCYKQGFEKNIFVCRADFRDDRATKIILHLLGSSDKKKKCRRSSMLMC